ncbi:ABC transporter ATP-binding protein [Parvularcula lutaonensis]|uniref:ABC transporter ATP-binding protein n=1 Tax=Parvularcula lutaonensis TaxID=491923 RepID=A0ABV7M842_9PROT|nr:ABC transporter ATP-binding protein [Parvularcula lutaonensis]GGY56500.1 sugar ABC transporter ATP-binding protein [Parvularcula lutaonensis]
MPRILAENVSLVHPLFVGRNQTVEFQGSDKFVRNRAGRPIGVKALRDVSFEFSEGSRVGLIGANGSGKTTLLRVLAGILPPDEGVVTIEGRSTNLININLGTKADASGHRNITLQALASGYSREEIESKRREIVEFSELGDFLELPVNTYSAGMRMRLSFAIATAFEPEILLLDEWLSAGDIDFKRKASKRMASFIDRAGVLVLASHSKAMLEENCERAIWLDEGIIRADGPVKEVFAEYQKEKSTD